MLLLGKRKSTKLHVHCKTQADFEAWRKWMSNEEDPGTKSTWASWNEVRQKIFAENAVSQRESLHLDTRHQLHLGFLERGALRYAQLLHHNEDTHSLLFD